MIVLQMHCAYNGLAAVFPYIAGRELSQNHVSIKVVATLLINFMHVCSPVPGPGPVRIGNRPEQVQRGLFDEYRTIETLRKPHSMQTWPPFCVPPFAPIDACFSSST